MLQRDIDILANRFNYEPDVMMGCSQAEISKTILYVALPIDILSAVLLLPVFSNFLFGLAAGMLIGIGMAFGVFKFLQVFRKDQEMGYITQLIQKKCAAMGLGYKTLIHRTGTWMIGHTL
jgi:conjugative transfer region protein (TIGR03750 family)